MEKYYWPGFDPKNPNDCLIVAWKRIQALEDAVAIGIAMIDPENQPPQYSPQEAMSLMHAPLSSRTGDG